LLAYVIRRLGVSAILLLVVVLATFLLHHALPGDPAAAVLGKQYTKESAHEFREKLGLNDPLHEQFGRYVANVAQGDLGRSHNSNNLVTEDLKRRLPATIELGVAAMIIATFVGIGLGVFTAVRPRSWWDVAGLTAALAGVSLPIFWLGFMALQVFGEGGALASATGFGGLPLGNRSSPAEYKLVTWVAETPGATGFFLWDTLFVARDPQVFLHVCKHLLLPAVVLSSVPMAVIARITRASMGEALLQDYVRTARAKGLRGRTVVLKHALRNASIPITTAIGTQLGYMLGGAVLTETIFEWPGMGTYVVAAILDLDVKPLQACVLVIAVGFVFVNLAVDVSYAFLDPRVGTPGETT
jgi:peptide/nickel transport system permease protein